GAHTPGVRYGSRSAAADRGYPLDPADVAGSAAGTPPHAVLRTPEQTPVAPDAGPPRRAPPAVARRRSRRPRPPGGGARRTHPRARTAPAAPVCRSTATSRGASPGV